MSYGLMTDIGTIDQLKKKALYTILDSDEKSETDDDELESIDERDA